MGRLCRKGLIFFRRDTKRLLILLYAFILAVLAYRFLIVSDLSDWRPSSNRFAAHYISQDSNSVLIFPSVLSKGQKVDILGVIHSDPTHFEHRDAIRKTWLKDLEGMAEMGSSSSLSFTAVFLVGSSSRIDASSKSLLKSEADAYGDMIVENFEDTYNNLTLKSILMLKFVIQYDLKIKYLFKMDDDTYFNAGRSHELIDLSSNNISGHKFANPSPIRISTVFFYDKKWVCPRWMYEEDKFPPYVGGPGYLLPGFAVPILFRSAFQVPFIHLEDVFITGILAEMNKIPRKGLKSFGENSGSPCYKEQKASDMLFHPVSPDKMLRLHELIKKGTVKVC